MVVQPLSYCLAVNRALSINALAKRSKMGPAGLVERDLAAVGTAHDEAFSRERPADPRDRQAEAGGERLDGVALRRPGGGGKLVVGAAGATHPPRRAAPRDDA